MNDRELNQMLEEYTEKQINRLLGLEPTDNSSVVDNRQRNIEINKRWVDNNVFEHPQIDAYNYTLNAISQVSGISYSQILDTTSKGFKEKIEEHFGKTKQNKLIDLI